MSWPDTFSLTLVCSFLTESLWPNQNENNFRCLSGKHANKLRKRWVDDFTKLKSKFMCSVKKGELKFEKYFVYFCLV